MENIKVNRTVLILGAASVLAVAAVVVAIVTSVALSPSGPVAPEPIARPAPSTGTEGGRFSTSAAVLPFAQVQTTGEAGSEVIPTVYVQGTASLETEPDTAYLNLNVQSIEDSVRDAQSIATEATEQIVEQLNGLDGVDEVTTNLSISPRYSYDDLRNRSVIDGYAANYSIRVTIRGADDLGDVVADAITLAVDLGRDLLTVNNIYFGLTDRDELESMARRAAAQAARERANDYTGALGVSVGRVLSISELGASVAPPVTFAAAPPAPGAFFDEAASSRAVVETGQVSVSASVQIAFQIDQ